MFTIKSTIRPELLKRDNKEVCIKYTPDGNHFVIFQLICTVFRNAVAMETWGGCKWHQRANMRGSRLLGLVFYSGKFGFFLQAGRRAGWPKMKDNVETGFIKHGVYYTPVLHL